MKAAGMLIATILFSIYSNADIRAQYPAPGGRVICSVGLYNYEGIFQGFIKEKALGGVAPWKVTAASVKIQTAYKQEVEDYDGSAGPWNVRPYSCNRELGPNEATSRQGIKRGQTIDCDVRGSVWTGQVVRAYYNSELIVNWKAVTKNGETRAVQGGRDHFSLWDWKCKAR